MRLPRLVLPCLALLAAACVGVSPVSSPEPSAPLPTPVLATATPSPTAAGSTTPLSTPSPDLVPSPTIPVTPSPSPSPAIPKAVIIVGPTDTETATNLVQGEQMAEKAEAAGMQVVRVFYPHATWDAVLAAIQGASFVAYYGHGYGWPSNTDTLWEVQQDGMGLNAFDGSNTLEVHYYGANRIRQSVRLAPNAVVFVMRGCYTAGNGLHTDPIPTLDVARQRVDNFASGWLAVGAGAVYALAFGTHFDYPDMLMHSDATIDELFATSHEYVGFNELYFDSVRTPGTQNHLDPDPNKGYLRAVSGDLAMTTALWRSGAGQITVVSSSF